MIKRQIVDTSQLKKYIAELFSTFALVFFGTGAIIVNDITNGSITHIGVSLTFGLVVMTMIYATGDVSGAHLNPAVTFGFWISRRFSGRSVIPYIISQCAGALLASLTLHFLFVGHPTLGATLPSGSIAQSFLLEVILTSVLMFVILGVSTGSKEKGLMAGVAIGAVITFGAIFAGPISGASMNPARSFAPALIAGNMDVLWLYMTAPPLGSFIAVLLCRFTREKGCCCKPR